MASTLEDKLRPDHVPILYTYKGFKWDQFFVGMFGALAIFGVLMKLWDEPFWGLIGPETADLLFKIFMPIGFLGECIVFIIMGFIKSDHHVEVYPTKKQKEEVMQATAAVAPREAVTVNMQLPESVKAIIEKKLMQEMDGKMKELSDVLSRDLEETKRLLSKTNEAYAGLGQMGDSLLQFSNHLKQIEGKLKAFENLDASMIAESTSRMSKQLDAANNGVEKFQTELNRVSEKFKNF